MRSERSFPTAPTRRALRVTTDFQAFGLMVTAEPYSAVRQPSDVVVAENSVRDDTTGKIEQVDARYELLPRGHYTWQVSNTLNSEIANAPKVSMRKYEALLELYQAQNALAIAQNAHADQYAPNTFAKAQQLLTNAEQLNANKSADNSRVVESAREAAQTAEDARVIAEQHKQEEKIAAANAQVRRRSRPGIRPKPRRNRRAPMRTPRKRAPGRRLRLVRKPSWTRPRLAIGPRSCRRKRPARRKQPRPAPPPGMP